MAVSLSALVLLAGCKADEAKVSSTSLLATSTTVSSAVLKAALLMPADVPGSTVSTTPPDDLDVSACFPGNPLGAKGDPAQVASPDLELTKGKTDLTYSSSARSATVEQATSFVTTFRSPAGSACVLSVVKSVINDPNPPKVDASGLTGTPSDAAVADGGALLAVRGNIKGRAGGFPVDAEMVAFRKGSVVVLLSAGALGGPKVPGQALALAQKIAGRLP